MEQEAVVWEGKPSWMNYPVELILGVVLLPAMGLGLLLFALAAAKRALSEYKVTNQRVISKVGLFNSKRSEVEISDIRNLNVTQDLWQRICGMGTLEISTAGGSGVEVAFYGVADPDGVKEKIRSLRGRDGAAPSK